MKKLILFVVTVAFLSAPFAAMAFPPKKGEKPCTACHTLSKKEAEAIVKKVVATGTVREIVESPIKGVWQIDVDAGERHGALYLDFSKKYLLAGQIVPVAKLGQKPPERKVDLSRIPLDNALYLGNKDAKNRVIVFSDPECPFCRELEGVMHAILKKRKDIVFAIILNPLPMHKGSFQKAQAIQCADSTQMLDDAFAGKPIPAPTCPPDKINQNKELAAKLQFNGTPTLVRDDGTVLSGFLPEEQLLNWIDKKDEKPKSEKAR